MKNVQQPQCLLSLASAFGVCAMATFDPQIATLPKHYTSASFGGVAEGDERSELRASEHHTDSLCIRSGH
jgi:hypothetical protein